MIFILGMLLFALPGACFVQAAEWSWFFKGGNFNINNTADNNFSPAVAASDESTGIFLVVWVKKGATGFDIYGARFNDKGANLEVDGEFAICTAADDQVFPSVSWNGETFLVVWQDGRSGIRSDIYGTRVTPKGTVLDPNGFPIYVGQKNYNQVLPVVSFDGTNHLVVWAGRGSKNIYNIYAKRVATDATLLDQNPVPIAPSSVNQTYPAVDFDGNNYLIVWREQESNSDWNIMGARITPLGSVIDTGAVKLNLAQPSGKIRKPIVCWNGESYLIVWMVSYKTSQFSLYGKRVGPGMEILDLTDVDIESAPSKLYLYPAIIRDGSDYSLIWEETDGGRYFAISGANADTTGPSISISDSVLISFFQETAGSSSFPALATLGETALVVWEGNAPPNGSLQIFGQLLSKTK